MSNTFRSSIPSPRHAHDHAALGGAVELGDGQAGDVRSAGELLRLREGVLARGGVQDQHHVVRAVGDDLADDVADLGQLVHQVHAVVQAAGRVDDRHVGAAGDRRRDGVVGHRGGVGAHRLLDDVHAGALGPDGELVHRGGAERVRSAQQDLLALAGQHRGQLADGRGLAHAVHADHQDDIRLLAEVERFDALAHQGPDLLAEQAHQLVERHEFVTLDALLQGIDDLQGRLDTHVRLDQGLLDRVEGVFIHPRLADYGSGNPLKET